MYAGGTKW